MNGKILGKRLRLLREQHGMRQAALADAMDITPNGLNLLECGHIDDPHISRVVKAAYIFHVSADYLLGIEIEGQVLRPEGRSLSLASPAATGVAESEPQPKAP